MGAAARCPAVAGVGLAAALLASWGSTGRASTAVAGDRWQTVRSPAAARSTVVAAPTAAVGDVAAVRRAQHLVGTVGPWSHLCLGFVRQVFGLPGRDPSAIAAWHAARFKHAGDPRPPAGVPVFWSGGGPGHVAVSMGGGWIVTSDLPSSGHVAKVQLSAVQSTWHLKYLGWTDDLEGVRVRR